MQITAIEYVLISGGWYVDDKAAIEAGGVQGDHYLLSGAPRTPGFRDVREVGRGVGVLMHLEGGHVAYGDGTSVTYAGAAGRDPVFRFEELDAGLVRQIERELVGEDVERFLTLADAMENLGFEGRRPHTALRYAVSQALLEGAAWALGRTKAEVVAESMGLSVSDAPLHIGIQSGNDRYDAVDKAIYRRVDAFPHGLIHDVELDLGVNGEKLIEYARWIMRRLREHRVEPDYRPAIHFDCYGTIGRAFRYDLDRMSGYLIRLESTVAPLTLQIESPVEMDSQPEQIETLKGLRDALAQRGSRVVLIADEWCNSLEDVGRFAQAGAADMIQVKMPDLGSIAQSARAVMECKRNGVMAYLGGSCNETDLNARNAVHVALATGADQLLARPGMGVDEGVSIMRNEETRLRAMLAGRHPESSEREAQSRPAHAPGA